MKTRISWKPAWGALSILLLGLTCGAVGETLLFVLSQCRRVEASLLEDFRVFAFVPADPAASKAEVLEEKVRALPGVAAVRYVSRERSMADFQNQDPELVRSVALLGDNPIDAFFEIRLDPGTVARLPEWLGAASRFGELGDIRFKPLEAAAIAQLQFYRGFLKVAISLAAVFWLTGAAGGLAVRLARDAARRRAKPPVFALSMAGLGAFLGMAAVYAAAYPMRLESRLWVWPPWHEHVLLLLVSALGGGLRPEWGTPSARRSFPGLTANWTARLIAMGSWKRDAQRSPRPGPGPSRPSREATLTEPYGEGMPPPGFVGKRPTELAL